MKIQSKETEIRGNWQVVGDQVKADTNCRRIDVLMSQHLKELGRDASGWDVLYVDPSDGRLWELTYPQADMHGGGPPLLKNLSQQQASESPRVLWRLQLLREWSHEEVNKVFA